MSDMPTMAKIGTALMVPPGLAMFIIILLATGDMAFGSDDMDYRIELAGYAVFCMALILPGWFIYLIGMTRK